MNTIWKLLLCGLLTVGVQVTAQTTTQEVGGVVVDMAGAAIPGARLLLHWDNAGTNVGLASNVGIRSDTSVTTDKEGHFQIELPEGFYDVFVTSSAFTPAAVKIRVRKGGSKPLRIKLKADPLVTRELAD